MSTVATPVAFSLPHAKTLEIVLSLATCGWRLLPCVERSKTPLIRDWPRRASSDANVIRRWAQKYENCNWAVACGPGSDVFVVDVDDAGSWSELCQRNGGDVDTLAVKTSRGRQLYLRYPTGSVIRPSVSKIAPHVDVRGVGSYAMIPPSLHPSGFHYAWIEPRLAVSSPPAWLLGMVTSAARPLVQASEIGILPEGRRNDGLTRVGGYLRRKGATPAEIEIELLEQNARRCQPPLPDAEVRTIATSVSRYEPGGPDPLEAAWQAIQAEPHNSRYEQFVSLICRLQRSRPGRPVILPLERIAELMGVGWTSVRGYRKSAVLAGLIHRTADPVPHRRAAEYRVTLSLEAAGTSATMGAHPATPTITPTIGLVAISDFSHGGNRYNSHGGNGYNSHGGNESAPRCYVHRTETEWWRRIDGDLVCGRCHPNPTEVRV